MKTMLAKKTAGFYLLLLAGVLAIASGAYYLIWSTANYALNPVVPIAWGVGLLVNILLIFWDNDYLLIILTALYSVGLFQLLVDSAGSFADAYQGIVMFGDPTQVGTILTISAIIAVGIVACIAAGFMGRKKV